MFMVSKNIHQLLKLIAFLLKLVWLTLFLIMSVVLQLLLAFKKKPLNISLMLEICLFQKTNGIVVGMLLLAFSFHHKICNSSQSYQFSNAKNRNYNFY